MDDVSFLLEEVDQLKRGFEGMLFFNLVFETLEEHMEKVYMKMERENR